MGNKSSDKGYANKCVCLYGYGWLVDGFKYELPFTDGG
jgi:hypothetical protein